MGLPERYIHGARVTPYLRGAAALRYRQGLVWDADRDIGESVSVKVADRERPRSNRRSKVARDAVPAQVCVLAWSEHLNACGGCRVEISKALWRI